MSGHLPSLDAEALHKLRRVVMAMHEHQGRSLPLGEIVRLTEEVSLEAGVTIDFQASVELGSPMVVLRVPTPTEWPESFQSLTRRERQVAALLATGLANKEIGRRLFISLATVKDHVHNILEKTGLPRRTAVAAALAGRGPTPDS